MLKVKATVKNEYMQLLLVGLFGRVWILGAPVPLWVCAQVKKKPILYLAEGEWDNAFQTQNCS